MPFCSPCNQNNTKHKKSQGYEIYGGICEEERAGIFVLIASVMTAYIFVLIEWDNISTDQYVYLFI